MKNVLYIRNRNRENINRAGHILFVVLAILLGFHVSSSDGEVMPEYDRLSPITNQLNAPTAVAFDRQENIYVTEAVNNALHIYSQSGEYKSTFSKLDKPISVAIDDSGRIFIGNKGSGNVEVYDADLNYIFKLGPEDGLFAQPNDIAIDDTGRIYIADMEANALYVYNPDGSYHSSIGSPGSGDGQFNKPASVEINQAAGEIIVLDRQLVNTQSSGVISGARIQRFNMDGTYKGGFSSFGNEIGKMFRPEHLAVDTEGRIYVTDTHHNVILVYDVNGVYLGAVFDLESPLRTPLGIAISKGNRLCTASLNAGRVEIYGIGLYTQMSVNPLSLNFEGRRGGGNPASRLVEISNIGTADLNWTAGTNESWIILPETKGHAVPAESSQLTVGINTNGLASGTYTGSVSINAESGATETVKVYLTVLPTPVLSVEPGSLEFTAQNGAKPSPQHLLIKNTGDGALNWGASSDRDWLTINKREGAAPDTIAVSVEITSDVKNAGTYSGAVTVTGQNTLSGPVVIPVTLNIREPKGSINVTTNLAEATFTINGAESYSGNGTNWIMQEASTGLYAIVFGQVEGYATPVLQGQTLEMGGTITFNGEYISKAGEPEAIVRSIIAGAGPGEDNEGTVKVFKADGTATGLEFTAHGYGYGVNVAAGDINKDGIDEIITAPGPGEDNPAEIRIYDRSGNELSNLRTTAGPNKYGANVAAGDFNGDGYYEVVAGAGEGAVNPSDVKVFVYDTANNMMVDSGINLSAFNSGNGVKVAAGDIDGDGKDELITAPGHGEDNKGIIKLWDVDTSLGVGQWSVSLTREFKASLNQGNSVSIAGGDTDGDGQTEIITGAGPHRRARDEIKIFDGDGDLKSEFTAVMSKQYGVNVAGGDLNNDGTSEIVAGSGPGERNRGIVKIFDADGAERARFKAFETRYGVNVAVGNIGKE
ncbi:MAG: FG-GAP repeat protein [Nitrospirae bacterium]|nr:FG-GAP repeat protein [Nitrospirota bacterium]